MTETLSECVRLIERWPSDTPFSLEVALEQHPHLGGDRRSLELLVTEAFIRRLESGERVRLSSFLRQFPDTSRSLARRLGKLADLHDQAGLLRCDATEQSRFPNSGDCLNGYTLLEEIGRGAFSRVFIAADDNAGNRRVIVKVTTSGLGEAEFLGPLDHPNLPRVLSCSRVEGSDLDLICMEFIGYRTLVEVIEELHTNSNRVDAAGFCPRVVWLMRQVASGLMYAHEHGILHLDIKPGNVVVGDDDRAVLIDFNLSAPMVASNELGYRGTLAYAAPEVLESAASATTSDLGIRPVSAACDVYSLGVVMYEVLTGDLPWPAPSSGSLGESAVEALVNRRRSIDPPSTRNPAVDSRLDSIVMKALEFSTVNRFHSTREFCAALASYQADVSRRPIPFVRGILAVCVIGVVMGVLFGDLRATHNSSSNTTSPARASQKTDLNTRLPSDSMATAAQQSTTGDLEQCTDAELHRIAKDLWSGEVPARPHDLALHGYIRLLLRDYHQAAGCLRRAVIHGLGQDSRIHCNLGYCYFQQRQYSAAEKSLDAALELAPEHGPSLLLRCVLELELSRLRGVPPDVTYLDRLMMRDAESTAELVRAAVSYERCCRPELSIKRSVGVYERHVRLTVDLELTDATDSSGIAVDGSYPLLPHSREERAMRLGLPVALEFIDGRLRPATE